MYTALVRLWTDEVRTYRCKTRDQLRLWIALLPRVQDLHVQHGETALGEADVQQLWEEACGFME